MIYITGDTHGQFSRIESFCEKRHTSKEDILIILGDAGINFYGYVNDQPKKVLLESLPITIFVIHGNHEMRPQSLDYYEEMTWHQGIVYYEKEYPHLLFGKDGEIYDFDGMKTVVMGGAYSVDKMRRIIQGWGWWEDEQPSDDIKADVKQQLEKVHWKVDVVLSHTVPLKYEPIEAFLTGVNQRKVDKSTEEWLDEIESCLEYKKWYAGHYHLSKKIDDLEIMFENIDVFYGQ